MDKKVLLILVDGMRPDSINQCGHPFLEDLRTENISTLEASAVMPSVTLPCHMSLFHSVDAERHGIMTNTWTPQVRPIKGLCEVLSEAGRRTAFFYNWDEIRDLARPGSISYGLLRSMYSYKDTDRYLSRACAVYLGEEEPDFTFLYLGQTDEVGHRYGWMSKEYLDAVAVASACIQDIWEHNKDKYTVIITADHGGHQRTHGSDMSEDMRIPLIIYSPEKDRMEIMKAFFQQRTMEKTPSLIDIAPTIAALLEVEPDLEWEGRNLLC